MTQTAQQAQALQARPAQGGDASVAGAASPESGTGGSGSPAALPGAAELVAEQRQTNAALQALARALTAHRAEQPAAAPAQPARQRVTEAQVFELVDAGKLSHAQAIAALRAQDRQDMQDEIARQVAERTRANSTEARVQASLDRLTAAHPGLLIEGSPERQRVQQEYTRLVREEGYAEDLRTELAAARLVAAELRPAAPAPADPIEETTAASVPAERTTPAAPRRGSASPRRGVWDGIPADARKFYEACIKRGQFKDDRDPKLHGVLDDYRARNQRRTTAREAR